MEQVDVVLHVEKSVFEAFVQRGFTLPSEIEIPVEFHDDVDFGDPRRCPQSLHHHETLNYVLSNHPLS